MADVYPRFAPVLPDVPDIVHFTGANIDEARSVLNRFFYPVAVGMPEGSGDFQLEVGVIQLGPLTVGQLSFANPVTLLVAELDAYHVSIPTAGHLHARHAGHEVVAGPSTGVIFGPGSPVYTSREADSVELAVKVERKALEAELSGLLGRPIEGSLGLPPEVDFSTGPGYSWIRLIRLLCDELEYESSLFSEPAMAEQLRSTILSGLLLCLPHRYHAELTGPVTAGPPRAIRRVVDAIQSEPERAFTVSDLARIANMSVRSLQEGFRRHVGTAPMTYLQQVRLGRAQEALRRADPVRVTVAAVAHRWGFAHLGRFASAYRARFGESPSETLRSPR
ncbi:helix-turn-helix transcriptional regulator [Paractinoplanes brasiliensis]|uniref:AraC family transcriptional regulator n=1 Tax=Paractinoplanes brasiliensis TaxID=52695 RepID=A0A4R6JYU7_9ACTN|nr:AraC family transcriptional regulator [Actinoplanes brasiliensis]TDO40456.1 AraC family transcriptional regulator [Actinoplanes brasiliensis]GID25524.1 transcriptional regulator [Actinoplanes brasiliensis]